MLKDVRSVDHRLLVRQCLACGYDGELLHGGRVARCPQCGCDMRRRPARSYAEMEGLLGQPVEIEPAAVMSDQAHQRFLRRWILFMFFSILLVLATGYLVAAALPH